VIDTLLANALVCTHIFSLDGRLKLKTLLCGIRLRRGASFGVVITGWDVTGGSNAGSWQQLDPVP
jgi:hypothetical protein